MNRRDVFRKLFFTDSKKDTLPEVDGSEKNKPTADCSITEHEYSRNWKQLQDGYSPVDDFWWPDTENWYSTEGALLCLAARRVNAIYLITHTVSRKPGPIKFTALLRFNHPSFVHADEAGFAGFRLSCLPSNASVEKNGSISATFDAGISANGCLFIGDKKNTYPIPVEKRITDIRLVFTLIPQVKGKYFIKIIAFDSSGNTLAKLSEEKEIFIGGCYPGLISGSPFSADLNREPVVRFYLLEVAGEGISKVNDNNQFFNFQQPVIHH